MGPLKTVYILLAYGGYHVCTYKHPTKSVILVYVSTFDPQMCSYVIVFPNAVMRANVLVSLHTNNCTSSTPQHCTRRPTIARKLASVLRLCQSLCSRGLST